MSSVVLCDVPAAVCTVAVVTAHQRKLATAVLAELADRRDIVDDVACDALSELDVAWHRHHDTVDPLVVAAAVFAADAHRLQRRRSGELYISHPFHVAAATAAAGFDATSVAAALLHDVVEDCAVTVETVADRFGDEVAFLVDGVSKIEKVHFPSAAEAETASMTKFLVAVAGDVRVLAVKLADRLHNLRTAGALSRERQLRLAAESLEVFSPLAHRLGMEELRCELEDLAFELQSPDEAAAMRALVGLVAPDADRVRYAVSERIATELAAEDTIVEHRIKHLYSLYTKHAYDGGVTDIHDLIGIRVVVGSEPECYRVLGVVHTLFTPVPGRFKDFIALPRANGYQSLHTTVAVDGYDVEVQIRTRAMHAAAKFGVAAHYRYKEGTASTRGRSRDLGFATAIAEGDEPPVFLEKLRAELAPPDEVTVLTPEGRPVTLPKGACAIDFAYKIHTEVGHQCVGVRVDGRLTPVREPLWTGATVEVLTAASSTPKRDWLSSVRTPRARAAIRRWFSERAGTTDPDDVPHSVAEALGTELQLRGLDPSVLDDDEFAAALAHANQYDGFEELLAAVWRGDLRPRALRGVPPRTSPTGTVAPSPSSSFDLSGLPFRVARCCNPTALDESAGFVSASRVVSVHRADCANYLSLVQALPPEEHGRVLSFGPSTDMVWVEVRAADRDGLLRDVSATCADLGVNITEAATRVSGASVVIRFEVSVGDDDHLDALRVALEAVPSVLTVTTSSDTLG